MYNSVFFYVSESLYVNYKFANNLEFLFNLVCILISNQPSPRWIKSAVKRKTTQEKKAQSSNATPLSTRSAGAGGSSSTMMKLFTDEAQGLRVDPLVVLFLAVGFIFFRYYLTCVC